MRIFLPDRVADVTCLPLRAVVMLARTPVPPRPPRPLDYRNQICYHASAASLH